MGKEMFGFLYSGDDFSWARLGGLALAVVLISSVAETGKDKVGIGNILEISDSAAKAVTGPLPLKAVKAA